MTDNSFGFLNFLVHKGYLQKLKAPMPGCLVIKFDGDKIIENGIQQESQNFSPANDYQFFEALTADLIKKYFVEYVTTERVVLPFQLKSY